MNLNDALRAAEVVVIEGDKRAGKNTFFMHILHTYMEDSACIFITPQSRISLKRRFDVIASTARNLRALEDNLDTFIFRQDWKEVKQQFGFHFLLQDIERIFQQGKGSCVVIHHFEDYFEFQEKSVIEEIVLYLTDLQKKYHKKLFFILNNHAELYDAVDGVLSELADIKLLVQLDKQNNHVRKVKVSECIYPLKNSKYLFQLANERFSLVVDGKNAGKLVERQFKAEGIAIPPSSDEVEGRNSLQQNEVPVKKRLLLISTDRKVQKIHQYLLSDIADILLDISDNMVTTISKILSGPDIIIYNPDDESKVDLTVCDIVRENKLDSKLFYLSNHLFIRQEDRALSHHNGCDEIFSVKYQLGDYLIVLEKYLFQRFYSQRCAKVAQASGLTLLETEEEIQTLIIQMIEARVFFSVFIYYADEDDIIPLLLYKTLNRNDFAYINEQENQCYLLCMNTTKDAGKAIYLKLKQQQNDIHLKSAYDAIDLAIDNKVLGE